MRLRLLVLLACAAGVAGCGGTKHAEPAATPPTGTFPRPAPPRFRVALFALTHTPRAGTAKWWYVVRATTLAGERLRGRLTVAVVDPLGTAHLAQVGTSKRKLRDYPFSGQYRDFAQWPAASRGYRLTFRVTVRALESWRTVNYWVRPR
jgi:chitodextrinase